MSSVLRQKIIVTLSLIELTQIIYCAKKNVTGIFNRSWALLVFAPHTVTLCRKVVCVTANLNK